MLSSELSERLLDYAENIIHSTASIQKKLDGRIISGQLIRSATSAGANYEEACSAESRLDFIHKLQIVLKELKESIYWLKLLERIELLPKSQLTSLKDETEQLARIIARSVKTAKSKNK